MIIVNKSLAPLDVFRPESMSLNLEERKSTATMTLAPDAPTLNVGDWLLDDEEPGKGIVWRVKSVDTQYNTNTRTISLEHIINTLRDSVMFGEITPAAMAGNPKATTCTAEQAIRTALSYQGVWVLDTIEYSVSNPYSFNGDSVFSALETVTSSLSDAYWSYDLSRFPFKISIRRLSPNVDSEMRMDRNIQTLKRTVDMSRMYTRIYPIGQNNIHIPGDYISKNENLYGSIAVVETDQSKKDAEELQRWASERLDRHCEPSVTVQITGLELSDATGEPLDHFQINTKCRVPLPEFGTTIVEKVTKLSWSDKIKEPEKVTITLANLLEDVASIVNSNTSSSKKGARASAKKDEEDHAWFVDTSDHVGMVAEALLGPDDNGVDWSKVSTLIVDGEGIHAQVKRVGNNLADAVTRIDQNENAITLEAARAAKAEGELSGRITVAADAITAEVSRATAAEGKLSAKITIEADRITQEVANRTAQGGELSSRITQTASQIRSEVRDTANGLQSSITQTASQIRGEVIDTANGLRSSITQTASQIRAEVSDTANGLSSSITQTASQIRSEVSDTANGLLSSITQTASQIRSEVSATANDLHSSITQTASQIRAEVADVYSGLSSSITQTASQIRTEVRETRNDLSSSITQTASQIRSEVSDTANGLSSSITQTASQIRSEVSDSINGVNSSITQTASQIRSEVSDSVNGLSSSITQNSDKIALVVDSNNNIKAASIVASINNEQSSVVISADHINLDGYVTASQLNTQKARIDNMLSGDATFSYMVATSAYLGNANSTNVKIYNQTVRVYSVKDTNGTTRQVFGYTLS